MIVYMNNCLNRDHVKWYGNGAFYDLYTTGVQAEKANNLSVGQECIVATKTSDKDILFSWFKFLSEEIKIDENNDRVRVFYGEYIKSDRYSKKDAANTALYAPFFDKNCNFKRQSVIER